MKALMRTLTQNPDLACIRCSAGEQIIKQIQRNCVTVRSKMYLCRSWDVPVAEDDNLNQWFSTGSNSGPQGSFGNVWRYFGCHSWWWRSQGPGMLLCPPQGPEQPHHKE